MKRQIVHCLGTLLISLLIGDLARSPINGQVPVVPKSEAEFDVVVEKDVRVAVRDGTKLALDLYLPAREGKPIGDKLPVLLSRTPYNKNGMTAEARWFAGRGYAVVVNDVRGRYASEGEWRFILDDPNDGFDVIGWIGGEPWSNGKVGRFGTRYVGGAQDVVAGRQPTG